MSTEQTGWPEQDGDLTRHLADPGREPDGDVRPALGEALAADPYAEIARLQARLDETRPPIPMSLADRPVRGGLATPWVNVQLADGGTDFRGVHHTRYEQAWTQRLCQSCGNPLGDRAVLVCGPRQILNHRFDEPPVCPPCALYASRACPMVAGRVVTYPDRPRVVEGHRGETCTDPGCECGGWRDTDPEHSANQGGQPALPWYGCWVRPGDYQVTAHKAITRCSDEGCEHERIIVNGAILTTGPLKIMLIGEPGHRAGVAAAHCRRSC